MSWPRAMRSRGRVRSSATVRAVAIGAAVLASAGAALQARINGQLGASLHDGIAAGVISIVGGLILLAAFVPATTAGRRALARIPAALRSGELRWWQCLGGVNGGLLLASQGLTAAALGVTVFTVAVVAGTSAGSLAVDKWGIGPAGRHPLTVPRVVGAVLCVAAVALAGRGHFAGAGLLVVLPAIAGAGLAWQVAVNGRVGAAAGSPLAAALVNFVVATVTLLLVLAVELALRGAPAGQPPAQWWLYLGGIPGVVVVAVAAATVGRIGVLVLGLAGVAGQVAGSLVIDAVAGRPPTPVTWLAVALTSVAVWISSRRPRKPRELR